MGFDYEYTSIFNRTYFVCDHRPTSGDLSADVDSHYNTLFYGIHANYF